MALRRGVYVHPTRPALKVLDFGQVLVEYQQQRSTGWSEHRVAIARAFERELHERGYKRKERSMKVAEGMEPGECSDCKAPIYWVTTTSGAKMPLDRGSDQRVLVENGVARVIRCFVSHFATCPHAKLHRKKVTKPAWMKQRNPDR